LRGRAADAKPKHEHGQKTKRLLLQQNTETDAHILTERIEKHVGLVTRVVALNLHDRCTIGRIRTICGVGAGQIGDQSYHSVRKA
jgi:hypothetical protein